MCLKGGHKYSWFQNCVGRIRNNLTFHYEQSGDLIERAIADRAARAEARYSTITCGSTAYLWHFQVADEIVDSIAARQVWRVPRDKMPGWKSTTSSIRCTKCFLPSLIFLASSSGCFAVADNGRTGVQ
jgi:hypothetical protein